MSEIGSAEDNDTHDVMFIVGQISRAGNSPSYWISDDAGLGVSYTMVTSTGDRLIWSA